FPADEQNRARHRLGDALKGVISQRLLPGVDGQGRVAACEILVGTATVIDHIKEGRDGQLKEVMERSGSQYGMQTFDQHLIELYRGGRITIEAAKSAATSAGDFEKELEFGAGQEDARPATKAAAAEDRLETMSDADSLFG
ncbi:MAG TPA: type IV pili twitching motility protein PilT, partial [bacterium]|nr:type IV pili twitching motility protein PilT [bacterium]